MKTTHLLVAALAAELLAGFGPPAPARRRPKTLTVWRSWADKRLHGARRWPVVRSEFFPNGELRYKLSLDFTGDTIAISRFTLNPDSTPHREEWYNLRLRRWQPGTEYQYRPGARRAYRSCEQFDYTSTYYYDAAGRETSCLIRNQHQQPLFEYEYCYDAAGLLTQHSVFQFFASGHDDETHYLYEYARNAEGRIVRRDMFSVATAQRGMVIKSDGKDVQAVTYYGGRAQDKTLLEREFYNAKGEVVKTEEYQDGKPEFIRTYVYTYY